MSYLTNETLTTTLGSMEASQAIKNGSSCPDGKDAFEIVILTLTLPLWTFITLYLLLLLIHCLRRIQHFNLYDRCSTKNAYFRYDFHVVVGKYSTNFNTRESHLIVDLLDSQLISTMTIQIPSGTMFNQNQVFMYKHSRSNIRCVDFTIYRRHPIRDVKNIRVAHSCSNQDSRLFIYGINLNDSANGENKFFPITSVVKNRGTQWALNTTFDARSDLNFSKMGCDCNDPFGSSTWPTYIETLVIIFYLWCAVLCFGHLIPVDAIWGKTALHALTVTFIAGSSAVVIAFTYIRFVKTHFIDQHSESFSWSMSKSCVIFVIIILSLLFWALAMGQTQACKSLSINWMISSVCSGIILTSVTIIIYYITRRKKLSNDNTVLEDIDNILMKTNSRQNIEFVRENSSPLVSSKPLPHTTQQQLVNQPHGSRKNPQPKGTKTVGSNGSNAIKGNSSSGRKGLHGKKTKKQKADTKKTTDDTLDDALANSEGAYMKPRNRNSISQYV